MTNRLWSVVSFWTKSCWTLTEWPLICGGPTEYPSSIETRVTPGKTRKKNQQCERRGGRPNGRRWQSRSKMTTLHHRRICQSLKINLVHFQFTNQGAGVLPWKRPATGAAQSSDGHKISNKGWMYFATWSLSLCPFCLCVFIEYVCIFSRCYSK